MLGVNFDTCPLDISMAARRPPSTTPGLPAPDSMYPVCRNVTVRGRRTSVRMERQLWDDLEGICEREGQTVSGIVTLVDDRRGDGGLTAALRIFIVSYYRAATTAAAFTGFQEDPDGWSNTFARALTVFDSVPPQTEGRGH